MEYKITVQEITPVEGEKYPNTREIYQQVVSEYGFDLDGVIKAVNKINEE